ncbi:MAG: threonylcarbamoyl-AMP synthase [Victivallaceae bacterium]|nr:threonylcarbamoyl-AMP synthase [Victivallaceae bacterium]
MKEKDPQTLETALAVLRRGGVVLVPTETVYGLIAGADVPDAAEKIYALKRRPADKRLGFFAGSFAALDETRFSLDDRARRLAGKFWPGALTLILRDVRLGTAAIRVPERPFLQKLLVRFGGLLYQTSANLSGMPDAPDAQSAAAMLAGEADLVVDGGALPPGAKGSTIVDLTVAPGRIVRQGAVTVPEEFL